MPDRPVKLNVKVVPGASKTEIVGWLGGALKVRVSAPPERGKANAAVEAILSEALGLPRHSVRVSSGQASARKTVTISGLSETGVRTRLGIIRDSAEVH